MSKQFQGGAPNTPLGWRAASPKPHRVSVEIESTVHNSLSPPPPLKILIYPTENLVGYISVTTKGNMNKKRRNVTQNPARKTTRTHISVNCEESVHPQPFYIFI